MQIKEKSNVGLTTLFLQSSMQDSIDYYERLFYSANHPFWDAVILTASNELQAAGYQKQIDYRRSLGILPPLADYLIVPDEENRRVGSAGSTLSVLHILKEKYGDFTGKRFLVIHAGGNSSRCPQYSALGKLFAPLPTVLNGIPATLFDMLMVTMSSIPGRMKDGMLLLSGDAILLFNPLQCDFGSSSAAVISFKEDVEIGKDHGVYVKSDTGNVKKFLHKQSVERLNAEGAVDERNMCSIDTGAIWLCPEILGKLYGLVDTDEKYHTIVNDTVRLSLYSDIAYCLAEDSTLESFYQEMPEGTFCDELRSARKALWEAIGSYNVKLMCLAPARFVHFGSIPEILNMMNGGVEEYAPLGWKKQINSSVGEQSLAAYSSVLSPNGEVGAGSYLEVSYVHSGASVGKNSYISFADIHSGVSIPDNVLLHGLKQMNGKFVCRIVGINDNPKKDQLFGIQLCQISKELGTALSDTLWMAELYPECDTIHEAIEASLNLYHIIIDHSGDIEAWRNSSRKSLMSGFNDADPKTIIDWFVHMSDFVKMNEIKNCILLANPARETSSILNTAHLTTVQISWLNKELAKLDMTKLCDFSYAMRLYYYLGVALNDEKYTSSCFKLIADTVLNATLKQLKFNQNAHITTDEITVRLPLRVNWGGGWSDTCPHCIENGGTVLNAALCLDGQYPVEVKMVRINEPIIVFDSRDMDVHGEFDSIDQLQNTGDPFDPFALQKACLLACGIIPNEGGDLRQILFRLGGGFEIHSEVYNVPKGSGLGTSSILSAATVKAVFLFMGIELSEEKLYSIVLAVEQIMSTGGGWQDQIGGLVPGIKYITSTPGIDQKIKVEKVDISEETKKELDARYCVICSGQRRLARNLLRDVVGRYVGNEPDSLFAHKKIQETATLMRSALENGNVDAFAGLMNEHWRLSQMLDAGSTNSLIEQIFMSIEDLIDARMVCGAGGGGFLQVILKKGVTREQVHARLKEVFQDFPVDVWNSRIVYEYDGD